MRVFYNCYYDGKECDKTIPKFDEKGYLIPESNLYITARYKGLISESCLKCSWDICDKCERNRTIDGTCRGRLVVKEGE